METVVGVVVVGSGAFLTAMDEKSLWGAGGAATRLERRALFGGELAPVLARVLRVLVLDERELCPRLAGSLTEHGQQLEDGDVEKVHEHDGLHCQHGDAERVGVDAGAALALLSLEDRRGQVGQKNHAL